MTPRTLSASGRRNKLDFLAPECLNRGLKQLPFMTCPWVGKWPDDAVAGTECPGQKRKIDRVAKQKAGIKD